MWKLAILKYQDRLNATDSEGEDYEQQENEEIARINRKLSRTKLEKEYHEHKHQAKRELSPLRAESPYSRGNVGNFITKLKQAKNYQEISTICATPVPAIRPKPETQETPHYAQPTASSQAKTKPKIKFKPIKPQETTETQQTTNSEQPTASSQAKTKPKLKIKFKPIKPQETQEEFVSGITSNPASIPTSTPKKITFKKVEKPASQDQGK